MNIEKSLIWGFLRRASREVVIVAAAGGLVLSGIRAVQYLPSIMSPSPPSMTGPLATVGASVTLRNADLRVGPLAVLLIGSPSCRYCRMSAAFHRKLAATAQAVRVPMYIVVPDRAKAKEYITDTGLQYASARDWRDLDVRASGTPTIITVDSNGVAERMWIGRLPSPVEEEVIAFVRSRGAAPSSQGGGDPESARSTRLAELRQLSPNGRIQLVDPGERSNARVTEGAIKIPLLELYLRAPFELDPGALQVVDCSMIADTECEAAAGDLGRLHFQVASIGQGTVYRSCAAGGVRPVE